MWHEFRNLRHSVEDKPELVFRSQSHHPEKQTTPNKTRIKYNGVALVSKRVSVASHDYLKKTIKLPSETRLALKDKSITVTSPAHHRKGAPKIPWAMRATL